MVAQAILKKSDKHAPRERANGKWKQLPLLVRLKARNLYLVQGLGHSEIAQACGITQQASYKLVSREGWAALRKGQKRDLLAKQDARMHETQSEALDAIADVSSQHALQGLDRVGEALSDSGEFAARNFQSWTGGVKNLVSIMRDIRAPQSEAPEGARLNVFVLRVGDQVQAKPVQTALQADQTEINVTPTIA
jgi:hypothetical protein